MSYLARIADALEQVVAAVTASLEGPHRRIVRAVDLTPPGDDGVVDAEIHCGGCRCAELEGVCPTCGQPTASSRHLFHCPDRLVR